MTVTADLLQTIFIYIGVAALVVGLVYGQVRQRREGGRGFTLWPTRRRTRSESDAGGATDVLAPPGEEVGVGALEVPEGVAGRLVRLRSRLARSGVVGARLLNLLSKEHLNEADWEDVEEALLRADLGVDPAMELVDKLRLRMKVLGSSRSEDVRAVLQELLLELVDPEMDRTMHLERTTDDAGVTHPASVLVVGVNGTGKTTTVGKIARFLVAQGHEVVLGAADTFRAAAADQLQTWGDRVGVEVVRSDREQADPASVAFDSVSTARENGADVVLVDTAGRLQTKVDLMNELGKIERVISRGAPISEVLLVLDATTGQNGLRQAKVFAEVVKVSGIVLTKLDGTAKGGIVVAVQRELGVPVKFVGIGEGADDLAPFDPFAFVDALLS